MARHLSDAKIQELSLVFKHKDGVEFEPMNGEARVLSVKGASKGENLATKALSALKAYFFNDGSSYQFPVTEATDNIDNDGDGPEDYNAIVSAVCSLAYDINQVYCVGDDAGRSAAIVACIDSFLAGLDDLRRGTDEKAGAKHSKATKEHIAAMADAHAKMGEHIAALQDQSEEKSAAVAATDPVAVKNGEVNGEKAAETDMNEDQVKEIAAAAVKAALADQEEAHKAEIEAAKSETEAAKATADAEKARADEAKAEADAAKAAQVEAAAKAEAAEKDAAAVRAAAVNDARQPSAKAAASIEAIRAGRVPLADQVRAAMGANPISTVI